MAPKTADNLLKVLQRHCVRYSFLKGTKDIWCRDYMPIQIRPGYFQGYHYDPDRTIHEESAIEKCDADRERWMERWEEGTK